MNEKVSTYRITDFAESERPRERLARLGPKSLSNAELIAILLGSGVQGENAIQVGAFYRWNEGLATAGDE